MIVNTEIYLKENVDKDISIKPWQDTNILPIFLKGLYNFYEIEVLNNYCLVLEPIDKVPLVKDVKRHIKRVEELGDKKVILHLKSITRYIRKAYIENRIPFIVENGQMYLPFLGLDLKKAPESLTAKEKKFTRAAQIAYLAFLYDKELVITANQFATKFGYTNMTGSRALNELHDAKLISYTIGGKTGRTKEYKRIANLEYFEKGKHFLRNPVRETVYLRNTPDDALTAGLEALAEKSMINPPNYLVRAIYIERFKQLNLEMIAEPDIIGIESLVELQLWEYDPNLFKIKNNVDTMSLYASLQNENDERIEQALEAALGGEEWFMD